MPNLDGLFGTDWKPDETDEESTTQYFSFVNRHGDWYILKIIPVGTKSSQFRYARGAGNSYPFTTAWANHTTLTYGHFYESFNLGGALIQ